MATYSTVQCIHHMSLLNPAKHNIVESCNKMFGVQCWLEFFCQCKKSNDVCALYRPTCSLDANKWHADYSHNWRV